MSYEELLTVALGLPACLGVAGILVCNISWGMFRMEQAVWTVFWGWLGFCFLYFMADAVLDFDASVFCTVVTYGAAAYLVLPLVGVFVGLAFS